MPTYRLTIEYDGTKYSGWQTQLHHRTVQGVLVEALREVLGDRRLTLQGAGRTDAGVHALAQVASLRCARPIDVDRLRGQLERVLPSDLAILDVLPAADRPSASASRGGSPTPSMPTA
jgi:tRNA pseudouridine38-40 synthase